MKVKQFLALLAICAMAAFSGAVVGVRELAPASAQTAPLGNGGPALQCADATLVCTGGYNVNLNLNQANTWLQPQTFPNIIDTALGSTAGATLCNDGTGKLTVTGCVNLATAQTWSATQTFSNIADTALSTTAGTVVCSSGAAQLLTTTGCSGGGGGGDTITTPNGSLTVGGTSTATTLDINLAHTNEYTAQAHFDGAGGAGACAGTNYPNSAYGICIGGNNGTTNVRGILMGAQRADFNCTSGCTVGDSAKISFFNSLASGVNEASTIFYDQNSVGALKISSALELSGRLVTGTGNADGGQCTASAATTCTITLGHSFGSPMCVVTDQTNFTNAKCSVSGTTVTVTTAAATSDTFTLWVWGNGS